MIIGAYIRGKIYEYKRKCITMTVKKIKKMKKKIKPNVLGFTNSVRKKGIAPDPIKMNFFEFEFEGSMGETFEERLHNIREIGKEATKDFKLKYKTIQDWFTRYDQLSILSFGFYYFLTSEAGYDEEAVTGSLEFPPYYQELLQAFALTLPRSYDYQPFSNEVEKFKKDFKEIGELNLLKHYNIPESVTTLDEMFHHQLRSDMMMHTTAVRNWSYDHKMKAVTLALAVEIKSVFKEIHGFDPESFLKVLYKMAEEVEIRLNIHRAKTVEIVRCENYNGIFDIYESTFPVKKTSKAQREKMWLIMGKNIKNLTGMFLMHSDMFLSELFMFDFSTLERMSEGEISAEEFKKIMSKITLNFGDLSEQNPEHFLLGNPVHERPFINVDDTHVFSTMWSIMTHLSIGILEKFCSENENLRRKYNDERAQYLENQIFKLFKSSFPMAEIYAGSKWQGKDGKIYENDLLVIIDSFAFVVEAKSGQVSAPAKRGAPDRLFKTLQELIEEPSEQALRFIEFLKENPTDLSLIVKKGPVNKFNASNLKYFIPLGVTLTHLGMMGCNLKQLIRAGVTKKTIEELAPSINLTDLESVFDLLPTAAQKIHYLQRRRELEANIEYVGDELDLLAWYFDKGFNLGTDANKYGFFNISSKSKELNNYIIGHANNEEVVKPELQMTKWWKDMLTRIDKKQFQYWLEISYILLNIPIEGQELFEHDITKLKQKMLEGSEELPHNWILMSSQDEERRFYIAGYCYHDIYSDARNDVILDILDDESTKSRKGKLVIGMNIDKGHYPYSILGCQLAAELFDNNFLKMISENKESI
jgi:hypothetical protein